MLENTSFSGNPPWPMPDVERWRDKDRHRRLISQCHDKLLLAEKELFTHLSIDMVANLMHDSSRTLIPRARGCPKRIEALKQYQL